MNLREKEEYKNRLLALQEMFNCVDPSWSKEDFEMDRHGETLLGAVLLSHIMSNEVKISTMIRAIRSLIMLELMK